MISLVFLIYSTSLLEQFISVINNNIKITKNLDKCISNCYTYNVSEREIISQTCAGLPGYKVVELIGVTSSVMGTVIGLGKWASASGIPKSAYLEVKSDAI